MEPTSEQELRQMLENGDINQSDFDQLSNSMRSQKRVYSSVNTSTGSRKKLKVFAILNSFACICFSIAFIASFLDRNNMLFFINLICTMLAGINALRYWILFWSYE